MAVDMFLKIDALPGESLDATHKDHIEVMSFSWGLRGSAANTTQRVPAIFENLRFTKTVDKSSPKLFLHCAAGTHFPTAILSMRKAGANGDFLKITLSDVMVSSYQVGGAENADTVPAEQMSLNYTKIVFEYKQTN